MATITGTNGADTLNGTAGNDTIHAKRGDDFVDGSGGDDFIDGWDGNDTLKGGAGNDTLRGVKGDDDLDGGLGDDLLDGGSGNDTLTGGDGNDELLGGSGSDDIDGGSGADTIEGGSGHDTIAGGIGDDEIDGGSGHDAIAGGDGNDTIDGGSGNDTVIFSGSITDFTVSTTGGSTTVTGSGSQGTDTVTDVETLVFDDYTLSLTGDNNAPIAFDDAFVGDEDTQITGNVLADNGSGADYDFEGDTLRVVAAVITTANGGTVNLLEDGSFTYDPAADYTGPDSFSYTLSDGSLSNTGTVNITVNPVNDAPVAADDAFVGDEDTQISGNVLADNGSGADSDVDGDVLSVVAEVITTANGGTVNLLSDGSFTYDPAMHYNGPDSFSYTLSDGSLSDTATASITVTPVNDAPEAIDDAFVGDEDTQISGNVLADNGSGADSDIDGDSLSVTAAVITTANGGTVNLLSDGSFTYDPAAHYNGPDSFSYTLSDGSLSDTGTANITVNPLNDAPEVQQVGLTVNEADGVFEIDLRDYISDPDTGDVLSLSDIRISRDSIPIAFSVSSEGVITIDPSEMGAPLDTGEVLATRFIYTVTDDSGAANDSTEGMVDLTIIGIDDDDVPPPPVNTGPTALAHTVAASEGDGMISIALSDIGFDPDAGDVLTVTALTGTRFDVLLNQPLAFTQSDGNILINADQFFIQELAPVAEAAGDGVLSGGELAALALNFTIEDSEGETSSNVITLNLTGVEPDLNHAPVAVSLPLNPDPFSPPPDPEVVLVSDDPEDGATHLIELSTLVSDPDGDALTITPGNLEVGFDELTGLPITVPYTLVYDTEEPANVTGIEVTLADFGLGDGENVLGILTYSVSDGSLSAEGQVVINYTNEPATPPGPEQQVLDFEPFADAIESAIPLDTLNPLAGDSVGETYDGFLFQGAASVIETDELGGGRGSSAGIINGQTTSSGDNVMLGAGSSAQVPTYHPYLDELGAVVLDPVTGDPIPNLDDPIEEVLLNDRGTPVLDEFGDPILVPVTETETDIFALLAPETSFGIGGSRVEALNQVSGLPLPNADELTDGFGDAFNLDGLSLNVAEGAGVAVTVTTYRSGVVEEEIRDEFGATTGRSDYYNMLVAVDTFEFIIDAGTDATEIDFNDLGFADDATVPNTNSGAFDDIFAVSFVTDTGTAVVLDDILLTI